MKNVLTLMLGLALSTASFALPTHPSTEPEASSLQTMMYVTKAQKVQIAIGQNSNRAVVELRDEKGRILDQQVVSPRQKAVKLSYDVSSLAEGTYSVTIKAGKETVTKTFTISVPSERTIEIS